MGASADMYPPQFVGHPVLYFVTLFSLALTSLLALEWIWRMGWSLWEKRCGIRHPLTCLRLILILLCVTAFTRIAPNVVLMMRWSAENQAGRQWLYDFDSTMDAIAFIPFSAAWLLAYLAGPMIIHQLTKEPLPIHLWPTPQQMRRPLKIGLGVLAMAFALTYLR